MKKTKNQLNIISWAIAALFVLAAPGVFAQTGTTTPGATSETGTELSPEFGTKEAAQGLETKVEYNCPAGTTGTSEYTRKVYTRTNGTRFEEAWYLTKNNCTKMVEGALSPGQRTDTVTIINNSAANINNTMNNMGLTSQQRQEIQNMITYPKGTMATPIFTLAVSPAGGNPAYYSKTVCVYGIRSHEQISVDYWGKPVYASVPNIADSVGGIPDNQVILYGNFQRNLYPGWKSTGMYNNKFLSGPVCPDGSYIHLLDTYTTCWDSSDAAQTCTTN